MKSTLIGHATLLIQSDNTTLLSDPILFDLLWEELNTHCPRAELQIEKIPRVDILNISHRHQDHFDVRSLAFLAGERNILAPDATVLAPNDEILLDVLKELGFKNIRVVADFEPIKIRDLTLTPTPSLNKQDYFPEHGLLIHDGKVTIWNQVDTIVSPDIIQYIHELYGQPDFAHVRYLPLLEGNFSFHHALNLPFEEYSSFLHVVNALKPKFAVPGSAGFSYVDRFSFLNQYSFPTTQEQFLTDVADFCPQLDTSTFYPGDVAEVSPEGVNILRQSSDFVRMTEQNSLAALFKPVAEVTPIRTLTKDKEQHQLEMDRIRDFLENEFLDRLSRTDAMKIWSQWKVVYQLEVFGQGESEVWSVDFGKEPRVEKKILPKINLYEGISSSELYGLICEKANWDFIGVSAQYRTFHNIYRIEPGQFQCFPQDKKFRHPLMEVFPADRSMDREKFMKDVRRWKDQV